MGCECIKKREFDIAVTHLGCETLVIEDQSTWVGERGYDQPTNYNITLEIPSRNFKKELTVQTNKKNFFTSIDLFGGNEKRCLPDDILCITTESCGYGLSINRVFLCAMESDINELISKNALDITDSEVKKLQKLQLQLESLRINVRKGNLDLAKSLFKKLEDTIKDEKCENC